MYEFCHEFHCSPAEYESRPFKESQWLLQIHYTKQKAIQEAQDKAQSQQALQQSSQPMR